MNSEFLNKKAYQTGNTATAMGVTYLHFEFLFHLKIELTDKRSAFKMVKSKSVLPFYEIIPKK